MINSLVVVSSIILHPFIQISSDLAEAGDELMNI